MLCKNIMKYPIICSYLSDKIIDIAIKMAQNNLNFIPILNPDDSIAGVITQSDIISRVIAKNINPNNFINNYITQKVISCFTDQDISFAISKMADYQIKQILVIHPDKKIAGIISLRELSLNAETNKYLNVILYELFKEPILNPIKFIEEQKKI